MVRPATAPEMTGRLNWKPTSPIDNELALGVDRLLQAVLSSGRGVDFAVALLEETTDVLSAPAPRVSSLTEDQATFLVSSGAMTQQQLDDAEAAVARGDLDQLERRTRLEAVAASLSSAEVAVRLDIDASSVRHRVAAKTLYSFLVGTKRRYPAWQFSDDPKQPVLPGLPALIAAIPDDMHASSVQGFMSTPQESLTVGGTAEAAPSSRATPAEWLQLGLPVEDVLDILNGHLQT